MSKSSSSQIYKYKSYVHFDPKIDWHSVKSKIEDPSYIESHAFYPFIRYTKLSYKYPKNFILGTEEQRDCPKLRDIMYSSHFDRYIYEYYAHQLNQLYNAHMKEKGIGKCAIAYRTNLKGKSNIHFAKEVFDYIKSFSDCFIVVGDFTKYFDKINHYYLKEKITDLLGVNILPNDHYKVFRSITKYSFVSLDDILQFIGMTRNELNQL